MNTSFEWSPLLPFIVVLCLVAAAVLAVVIARLRHVPDFKWRGLLFILLAAFLMNPVMLHEIRQGLPDKLIIVVDESDSQKIGGRDQVAEDALAHITRGLERLGNVEPFVIRTTGEGDQTTLFKALRDALPGIPLAQIAGTVFITDGQVHDVPDDVGVLDKVAPLYTVLTGDKNEFDRKLTIISAPKYGLLSEIVDVAVKVEEFGKKTGRSSLLRVTQDGQKVYEVLIAPGEERHFTFNLEHPGQNVFEFSIPTETGELTAANNRAPVIVNGVRDRLRVLLVSGAPHMGERAWRNLLKSDPSIDLVHFTILRSLTSIDRARRHEMSLIPFPVEELFEKKLDDFDLIIFDKYQRFNLLTARYFSNIANYVRQGGAFLVAMDSDKENKAIFDTALVDVLPVMSDRSGEPSVKGAYRPLLTDAGRKHPVTGDLGRIYEGKNWGQWFAQSVTQQARGQMLMTGRDGLPLFLLDKVEQGRVAVLASDNVWIWSKGGDLHGPYNHLLRNAAHWLMKEPELEDNFIKAEARGSVIRVSQRSLGNQSKDVLMTRPSGAEEIVKLDVQDGSWTTARIETEQSGIYSFESFDGSDNKAFVAVGNALNEEFSSVHTTAEKLQPIVDKTGGVVVWYKNNKNFSLKSFVQRKNAYTVSNVESRSLFPDVFALLALLAAALLMWWREGGGRSA